MTVLVSYSYYEPDDEVMASRCIENLKFFLKEGVERFSESKDSPMVDTYVVIQGNKCSIEIPKSVTVLETENTGYDLGAHGKLIYTLEHEYDYYIFLNCGQRGPFLPTYWDTTYHWSHIFTDRLEFERGGCSSSIFWHGEIQKPILETWAFALCRRTFLDVYRNTTVFDLHKTKKDVVVNGEDTLGPFLYDNKYNISCLLLKYRDVNWSDLTKKDALTNNIPSRPWNYEGINTHPLETVFFKVFWNSTGDKKDEYVCPYEERYTQWAFGEEESRELVSLQHDEEGKTSFIYNDRGHTSDGAIIGFAIMSIAIIVLLVLVVVFAKK